jgi:hypothetical protein
VADVFADFLRYLFTCACSYISEFEGHDIRDPKKVDIEFILLIPNGWKEKEKQDLHLAAVLAGLIPHASDRLRFGKKGEATLHFGSHSDEKLSISLKVIPVSYGSLIHV